MRKMDREISDAKLISESFPTNNALKRYIKYKECKKKNIKASIEYIFREYILKHGDIDIINDSSTYRKSVEKINKKGYGSVITRKEFVNFVIRLHPMNERSNKFDKISLENYIIKRNFEIKLGETDIMAIRNPNRANIAEPKSLSRELWKIYSEWKEEWIENGLIENIMLEAKIKKGLIWNIDIVNKKQVRIKCYVVNKQKEYVDVFQNKDLEKYISSLEQGKCDIKVLRFVEKMIGVCSERMQNLARMEIFDELYEKNCNYILNSWFSGGIVFKNYKENSHIKIKLSEGKYEEVKKKIKNQEKK